MLSLSLLFGFACSAASSGSEDDSESGSQGAGASAATSSGNGFLNGSSSSGAGGEMGCAAETFPGKLVPVDLHILLDRSASMQDSGKWGAVISALTTFINDPSSGGIGVGLQYFPSKPAVPPPVACPCGEYGPCLPIFNSCAGGLSPDDSCIPSDYQQPPLPIATLPGSAGGLLASLQAAAPEGGSTPSQPAITGALAYVSTFAQANPTHLTFLVFASDGEPSGCTTNSTAGTAAAAQQAAQGAPEVKTFVIGVGDSLSSLNQVAASGGTDKAYLVDGGSNTTQEFINALNDIRAAGQCKFQIPVPSMGMPDFEKVNVSLVDPNDPSMKEQLGFVQSKESCNASGGWYYDNPADPKFIELCPASCEKVKNSDVDVKVILGCATVVN
jgi:hypothetical protein